ncbi:MAG: hypothetical protein QW057_10100 [Candidatus Bathyarchaeia archaeon]
MQSVARSAAKSLREAHLQSTRGETGPWQAATSLYAQFCPSRDLPSVGLRVTAFNGSGPSQLASKREAEQLVAAMTDADASRARGPF